MTAIIPILGAIWVLIKAGVELYANLKSIGIGKFVEGSEAHSNQHIAVGLGFVIYGLCVPLMIIVGGFEFSMEWIPLNFLVAMLMLYVNEHFAIEREERPDVIRFRDLFKIKWPKIKEKIVEK